MHDNTSRVYRQSGMHVTDLWQWGSQPELPIHCHLGEHRPLFPVCPDMLIRGVCIVMS